MLIDAHRVLSVEVCLEREAMGPIADGIAVLFESELTSEHLGLVVASDNAGSGTSVKFWADALRSGVALASPERFPWCLANAPCAALAQRFGVTGPNATLLGEADALFSALDTAADLLSQGRVRAVIVVVLCFSSAGEPGKAMALRLIRDVGGRPGPDLFGLRQACAPLTLRAAIEAVCQVLETP